ncbi:MAG: hypothetical protein LBH47_02050 [Christensenellaceae bacterium]|nr:hypothetical protein [Christensenellaceae bacterium]
MFATNTIYSFRRFGISEQSQKRLPLRSRETAECGGIKSASFVVSLWCQRTWTGR